MPLQRSHIEQFPESSAGTWRKEDRNKQIKHAWSVAIWIVSCGLKNNKAGSAIQKHTMLPKQAIGFVSVSAPFLSIFTRSTK
jgi:HD superfamily phosphohydrolase YqeK